MAIDVKNNGLDTKLDGSARVRTELNWATDDLPEGAYKAKLVIVYPWKKITKDTTARAKDDSGRYIKDANNEYVKDVLPNYTWHYTDVVFELEDSGLNVKGALSTHPDMIGAAKKFLYNAELYDVTLDDLKNNLGAKVTVHVKIRTSTYVDKNTGATVTDNKPYVSYYSKYNDSDTENLGI